MPVFAPYCERVVAWRCRYCGEMWPADGCAVCGHPVVWDKDFSRWLHKDFGPDGRSFDHDALIDGGES